MNVNFYVTCIADVVKSGVAKNTVLLLEKLGCQVTFLEKQGFYDLTDFIVNKLGVTDIGAHLPGRAVYHPSCSLFRKLGIVNEPIELLKHVKGLELLPIHNQQTCCGFGGTFSVKMAEISGEMVKEKVEHVEEVEPEYLIGADVSCLLNIGGRLQREGSKIKVMHIAEVLMQEGK